MTGMVIYVSSSLLITALNNPPRNAACSAEQQIYLLTPPPKQMIQEFSTARKLTSASLQKLFTRAHEVTSAHTTQQFERGALGNSSRKPDVYQLGVLVRVLGFSRKKGLAGKFSMKFKQPYRIRRQSSTNFYELEPLFGKKTNSRQI